MQAFITGSRAYGKPKPFSDIDLVVRVDEATARMLFEFSDVKNKAVFGSLNLILCTSDAQYAAWKVGTEELRHREGPSTREQAVTVFQALLESVGIKDEDCSGQGVTQK